MRVPFVVTMAVLTFILLGQTGRAQDKKDKTAPAPVAKFLGQPVEHWIGQLRNQPDRAKTVFAIEAILKFSAEKAALALQPMIDLHSTFPPPLSGVKLDPSVRLSLTKGIGVILANNPKSPLLEEGLKRLRASLKDPQFSVRITALQSLQLLGFSANAATDDVKNLALDRESWEIRQQAVATLHYVAFDPKTGVRPDIFDVMYTATEKDPCYQVRLAGIEAMLRSLNLNDVPTKQKFEGRMDSLALTDRDPLVQLAATLAVMTLKNDVPLRSRDVIANIMLKNPDPSVRLKAIETATKVGVTKKTNVFIEALIKALGDEDLTVQRGAIEGLGYSGTLAKDAVPELEKRISDKNPTIQLDAIKALGSMGSAAAPAVPSIMKKLEDPDLEMAAISALGRVGAGAGPAVPALVARLDLKNPNIVIAALFALGGIADPSSVAPLLKKCNDPNPAVQVGAIQALGLMGNKGAAAIPNLATLLNDAILRPTVIQTFANFHSRQANSYLVPLLNDPKAETVVLTLGALGSMGTEAAESVGSIAKVLAHKDNQVAYYAIVTLATLGPTAKAAVPDLQKLANDVSKLQELRTLAQQAIDVITEKNKKPAGK